MAFSFYDPDGTREAEAPQDITPQPFEPYEYQRYTIERMINEPNLGLFYRMGAGKTVITLTALNELIYRRFEANKALVIAPKYVAQHTWATECAEWEHLSMLRVSKVLGTEKQRIAGIEANADVYVINRENVAWLCKKYPGRKWPFDTVIVDELSSFRNPSAVRFKCLRKMLPLIKRLYGLTGTPSPKSYLNLWAEVYLLDGGERLGRSYTAYRNKYFMPGRRGPGGVVVEYKLRPGAREAIQAKIGDICVSLKDSDYSGQPEVSYMKKVVTLSPAARKKYDEMEAESLINIDGDVVTAQTKAVVSNKLLQIAGGAVYDEDGNTIHVHDQKIEALKELLEEEPRALVFYNYKHERERILEALKGKNVRELKDPGAIDAWNRHEVDVLLAHPASAAYGLNLQHGGHVTIWFSVTNDLELYLQANARLARNGQEHEVLIVHIIAEDTVDEPGLSDLKLKDTDQNALLYYLQRKKEKYDTAVHG